MKYQIQEFNFTEWPKCLIFLIYIFLSIHILTFVTHWTFKFNEHIKLEWMLMFVIVGIIIIIKKE